LFLKNDERNLPSAIPSIFLLTTAYTLATSTRLKKERKYFEKQAAKQRVPPSVHIATSACYPSLNFYCAICLPPYRHRDQVFIW